MKKACSWLALLYPQEETKTFSPKPLSNKIDCFCCTYEEVFHLLLFICLFINIFLHGFVSKLYRTPNSLLNIAIFQKRDNK